MRLTCPCLFLVVVVLTSASIASGQTATLSGVVTDQTGAVVPDATVTILSETKGIKRTAKSNRDGYYTVPFL